MPTVSVILAAYNGVPYVRRSIESILGQDFQDLELIVVDDGSTDGTRDVVAACARVDDRVVPLFNETNRGIVFSRNRGLERARGRYVTGQDADDVSVPHRLSRQVEYLTSHSGVGLVGTWASFIDEHDVLLPDDGLSPAAENARLQEELLDASTFCCATVMLRRELLDMVGLYDPKLPYSHDYDLLLRLSEVSNIANIQERLYLYRRHRNAVTSRHRPRQAYYKALALEAALSRRWGSAAPAGPRRLLGRDFLRCAYLAFAAGDRQLASEAYTKAKAAAPGLEHSEPLVEEVLGRYLLRDSSPGVLDLAESFFRDLLDQTPHLRRVRSRLVSSLHMRVIFETPEPARRDKVGEHLWPAIRSNPRWLLNRGVVSMLLQHVAAGGRRA